MGSISIPEHPPLGHFFFPTVEPPGVVRPIGQEVETGGRHRDGQAALDDKENAPGFNAALNVRDPVGLVGGKMSKTQRQNVSNVSKSTYDPASKGTGHGVGGKIDGDTLSPLGARIPEG